ncbi:hypothetical protein NDU88_002936, partial [Pleurodeles waltl]
TEAVATADLAASSAKVLPITCTPTCWWPNVCTTWTHSSLSLRSATLPHNV